MLVSFSIELFFLDFFLASDFCRFCVVIRFFHPRHNCQWPPTSKDFLSKILSISFIFNILILEKEPVFPFLMLSAKQGNYWYHFYNVFGMTRSLTGDWTRDLPHPNEHAETSTSMCITPSFVQVNFKLHKTYVSTCTVIMLYIVRVFL